MTVSITQDAAEVAASTLDDVADELRLDLRYRAPDCGDVGATAALDEWLGCLALVTATSAAAVRGLGQDVEAAAGTLAAADAALGRQSPAAGTGRARAV
ncbi:MAG TPA: hypothetical protein VGC67_10760 [Cellulomonas sp.]